MIRVAIIEDDPVMRDLLRTSVDAHDDMMVTGTALAVFFVPVFFVVVRSLFKGSARQQEMNRRHAEEAGVGTHD